MAPDHSQGSDEGPLTRLRVALFGAGLVGQAGHAPSLWDDRDRFEFVAVADPSASVRSAVAARYGVPHTCATLEDALALGLDAVIIAAPTTRTGPNSQRIQRADDTTFCNTADWATRVEACSTFGGSLAARSGLMDSNAIRTAALACNASISANAAPLDRNAWR